MSCCCAAGAVSVFACVPVCVKARARARVHACVRVCMRACVHACARVCVRVSPCLCMSLLAGECRDAAPPLPIARSTTHCPKHLVQRWGPAERCPELGGLLLDAPAWALQVLLDRSRGRASDQATPRRQAERVHVERLRNLAERAIVEHLREGVAVGARGSEVRPAQGAELFRRKPFGD